MAAKPHVCIYSRFSPRPGAATCESCDVQIRDMLAWVKERGYELRIDPQQVRDDALSGADDKRPGLARALDACKRGDIFLVRDFDRLSRDNRARLGYAIDLTRRGVKLVSLTEGPYKPEDKENKLLFGILATLGEYRRDCIRESTRTKMRQHQQNGRKMSGIAPYGTRLEGNALVSVPEEQAVIADMVAWHAAGESYTAIAERLNEAGVASRGNPYRGLVGRWGHQAVKRVIERAGR